MGRRKSFIAACALALGGGGALLGVVESQVASAASSGRTVFAGTAAPSAAKPANAPLSSSSSVNFELVMRLRDPSGAAALVRAVSTPGSPSYRHYLKAAQWEARFSPTASQVAQAQQWLRSQGFTLGKLPNDRLTVPASGSVAQVESAFDTSLANYTVAGHVVRLATRDMSVPSSVGGVIGGVMGVNQQIARPAAAAGNPDIPGQDPVATPDGANYPPPPPAFVTEGPCSTYYGQKTTAVNPPFDSYPTTVPYVACGYLPAQFRHAYGVGKYNGAGQTVAIIDAYGSATIASDAAQYFSKYDPQQPFSNAHFQEIDQAPFTQESACAASSWLTEQAIDVEAVHSTAPRAHILYVGAASCFNSPGLFDADQTVIDNGLANVMSNSWGDTGGDLLDDSSTRQAYDNLFQMADTTGISVLFSSGDSGDNFDLIGDSAADFPVSDPYVTSVGGTSTNIGSDRTRQADYGWDTGRAFLCTPNIINVICHPSQAGQWTPAGFDGASGGYTSYNYTQPWYQAGIVPSALATRNSPIIGPQPMRVEPDISADADPGTGFKIGLTETFGHGTTRFGTTRFGGTSLASPLLAGLVADANEEAGQALGFINPTLYSLDRGGHPTAIWDILPIGKLGLYRNDYMNQLVGFGSGTVSSFRELYYRGPEVYCDGTGSCYSRQEPLTEARGYDSLTGLGSPGRTFLHALATF